MMDWYTDYERQRLAWPLNNKLQIELRRKRLRFRKVLDLIKQGADIDHPKAIGLHSIFVNCKSPRFIREFLKVFENSPLLTEHIDAAFRSAVMFQNIIAVQIMLQKFKNTCNLSLQIPSQMLYMAEPVPYWIKYEQVERVFSLLVAAGADMKTIYTGVLSPEFSEIGRELKQARYEAGQKRIARACSASELERAAFDISRQRMTEVCIALANLMLPALLTTMILEEACAPPGANLRMYHSWSIAKLARKYKFAQYV